MRNIAYAAAAAGLLTLLGTSDAFAVTGTVTVGGVPPGRTVTLELVEEGQTTPVASATGPAGQAVPVTVPEDKKDRRLCIRLRDNQTGETRNLPCGYWWDRDGFQVDANFGAQTAQLAGGPRSGVGDATLFTVNIFGGRNFFDADGRSDSTVAPTQLTGTADMDAFKVGGELLISPFPPFDLGPGVPPILPFVVAGGDFDTGGSRTLVQGRRHLNPNANDQSVQLNTKRRLHAGVGVKTVKRKSCPFPQSVIDPGCVEVGAWIGGNTARHHTRTVNDETSGGLNLNVAERDDSTFGLSGGFFAAVPGPDVFGHQLRFFAGVDIHGQGEVEAGDFSTPVGTYTNTINAGTVVQARFGISIPFGPSVAPPR
jgi:hypothetical protein